MTRVLDQRKDRAILVVQDYYDAAATQITVDDATRATDLPSSDPDFGYLAGWYDDTNYPGAPEDDPGFEMIRVTGATGNVLTLANAAGVRLGQNGTTATAKNTPGATYKLIVGWTKDDIERLEAAMLDFGQAYAWLSEYGTGDGVVNDKTAFDLAVAAGRTTIVVPAGTWRVGSNLTLGVGTTVQLLGGAIIAPDAGVAVTILGPLVAGPTQHFGGAGTVSFSGNTALERVLPQWFGATPNAAAIQAAINSLAAGTVYFPAGTYSVSAEIVLKSNVHLRGEGKASLLKISGTTLVRVLTNGGGTAYLSNVVIDGIGFDGSDNYPADSTVYKATMATQQVGIQLHVGAVDARTTNDFKNITIRNCWFYKLSHSSIYINGLNVEDVAIVDNEFQYGSYAFTVITVRAPLGYGATQRAKRVQIARNRSDTNGPQVFYDPTKEDYVASSDGIKVVACEDSVIANNTVHKPASVGIRVELSQRVSVEANAVSESGSTGIMVYLQSADVAVVGNTIKNWGRTPPAYSVRSFGGSRYVAREFPHATYAALPADPTAAPTWWPIWPYTLDGVNVGSIIAYLATDYYTGVSAGILPFRGEAAIAITSEAVRVTVVGNATSYSTAVGVDGGLLYASDYGLMFVHPANSPSGTNGEGSFIAANDFQAAVYKIYHPQHHDPLHTGWGATLGKASYAARPYAGSLIRSARPAFSVRASAQLNIAINTAYTVLWATELADQGANFASNAFTAPVAGLYQFNLLLDLRQLDTAATLYQIDIVTSNRTYSYYLDPTQLNTDPGNFSVAFSVLSDMDAADVATVVMTQTGGAAQADIQSGSYWSGSLIE